jgi:hypothetical protein
MIAACILGLALWALPSGIALGAQNAPAWRIVQTTTPTNLAAGSEASGTQNWIAPPRWMVFVTNVGGATAGPATITDTLPAGVEVSASLAPKIAVATGNGQIVEPCAVAGQTVTCEVSGSLPPGVVAQITIPLAVSASASGEVVNDVLVSGGGAPAMSSASAAQISSALPDFGFLPAPGLRISAYGVDGLTPSAGSHPYDVEAGLEFPSVALSGGGEAPAEGLRSVKLNLPAGLVVDPTAVPVRCTTAQISFSECPAEAQVGVVGTEISTIGRNPYPLYAMVPPPGYPAEFAYNYGGYAVIHILGGVDGDFRLTAASTDLLTHFPIVAVDTFLWGVPSDSGHDSMRRGLGCRNGCSVEPSRAPLLTMPSSCSEAPEMKGSAESWLGNEETRNEPLTDLGGEAVQPSGCNALEFTPTLESKATTSLGDSPSGLDFHLHQPQNEALDGLATAALRDARVNLPEGMTLNASAANGMESCTESQIGYAPEEGRVRFATTPPDCPQAAKVGTLEVTTPLLDQKLSGSIYVAKPYANPFGSLLAIYLAIEDEGTGIYSKLGGTVETDPSTGQLKATFTESPQLPLEDIDLRFFNGARGVLTTPLTCGTKTTTATLTPWSTPEGVDAHPSDSFQTTVGCAASEAAAPKDVSFSAGTASPLAGAYSPFVLRIARHDGSQHITGIETLLPQGLIGKLAGVSYCPEAAIAQAQSREAPEKGREEQASPSCPSTSEVGTVQVTAGSGITPIPVTGHAYMAGPYKGAPLSLVAIVPAVAGPFDLGTVVDRVALHVGEYDARIRAVADPLPTIRNGIPLDVRAIELRLDRPGFTLNPTSCEAKAIEGSATMQTGQSVPLDSRFQVGECGHLEFKPKLSLSLKGKTTRSGHPALRAVLKMPKGGANIASAQVGLPHSEFLDQGNLGQVCTQGDLKAATCPQSTVYGHVKVWTPLFDQPLEGPVYLGVGFGYQLPALVAELNGQIRVLLVGKTDTTKKHGLRNTFEAVPDAPAEKLVLELKGGPKYGLLVNSENICRRPQKASASFTAANGKVAHLTPTIANSCKGGGKKAKGSHGGKKGRGGKQ